MSWPKGKHRGIKTGGRQLGTPNKRTVQFLQILEKHNFDSVEALIFCYMEAKKLFELKNKIGDLNGALGALDRMSAVASTIAGFSYPKKKAIDHASDEPKNFADFIASAKA